MSEEKHEHELTTDERESYFSVGGKIVTVSVDVYCLSDGCYYNETVYLKGERKNE